MASRALLVPLALLLIAGPSQTYSDKLKKFLEQTARTTGKSIYILPASDSNVSRGAFGPHGIYAFMRPEASEDEIVHEVLHSEFFLQGFAEVKSASKSGDAVLTVFVGVLASNLQDFVIHPKLDRVSRAMGFPPDQSNIANAKQFREMLKSAPPDTFKESNRLTVAADAMGIAEVLQRGQDPYGDLAKICGQVMPKAYSIANKVLKRFPANPTISAAQSYKRTHAVLLLLDRTTTQLEGEPPSSFVSIVNPKTDPPIDVEQERRIWQQFSLSQSDGNSL